eukprot:2979038-Prymnesium_polylepis.1
MVSVLISRPGGVQEEPAPPAAGSRQQMVILWGAEVGEASAARTIGRRCGRAGAMWRARASGRCTCGSIRCTSAVRPLPWCGAGRCAIGVLVVAEKSFSEVCQLPYE